MALRLSPRDHSPADRLQRGGKANQSADSRHPKLTENLQQLHMKNIPVRKAKALSQKGPGSQHVQGALPNTQKLREELFAGRTQNSQITEAGKDLQPHRVQSVTDPHPDTSPEL